MNATKLNLSFYENEMMEGYLDGLKDIRPHLSAQATNRSHSYQHGWLNGRDDRNHNPRAGAEILRKQAEKAISRDQENNLAPMSCH